MPVIRPSLSHLLALLCVLLLAPAAASAHEGHAPNATTHEKRVPNATADAEIGRAAGLAVPYLVAQCPGGPGGACCCGGQPASSGSPHIEVAAASPAGLAFFAARATERARDHRASGPAAHPCLVSCLPRAPPAP